VSRLPGGGERGALPPLLQRYTGPGSILCFHALDAPGLHSAGPTSVPVELFRTTLELVRRWAHVVPLSEILARRRAGQGTGGLVAITFDDAYRSVAELATPLLSARGIPVTLFVTTQAAETGGTYWWDRVEDLHPHVPPARWREFEDVIGVPEEYRRGQPLRFGPLRPLRQWVLHCHRGRWPRSGEEALASLEREAGFRTAQRSMTYAEIREFSRSVPVEIGIHTHTHPVLPLLKEAELRREIAQSYRRLTDHFDNVVPFLGVPFGLYDERTIAIAHDSGMHASLSVENFTLSRSTDPRVLHRFVITSREQPWRLAFRLAGLVERWRDPLRVGSIRFPALPSATT
jgi:peptidoglycan/xylan/chitin deacetylase (PgdA/CDA1 family)